MNTSNDNSKRYSTFAVLFFINKTKKKKSGLCPVMGRISVNAEMTQFSAKMDVNPALWDAKSYRMKGKSKEAVQANRELDRLAKAITGYYDELVAEQGYVTAELVKNMLLGIGRKKDSLLAILEEHNEEYIQRVGVNRKAGTYKHYVVIVQT